jgi:hypothetical protein
MSSTGVVGREVGVGERELEHANESIVVLVEDRERRPHPCITVPYYFLTRS